MFCEWKGNSTKLYTDTRQLWRIFHTRLPVQCAMVTGDRNDAQVAITMTNGRTCLFNGKGQMLRG